MLKHFFRLTPKRVCWRVLAAGFVLLGGPAAHSFAAERPPAQSRPATAETRTEYTLQPLDRIKIEVFQEPDLTREIRLSQEGAATFPLIGAVNLKGRTVREAQGLIRDLYDKDYLVNPQINLSVLEYARQTVDVLGAVADSGSIDIPPEQPMNLLAAIARAGGFTRLADRRKVQLTRRAEDGSTQTFEINADDIIRSRSSAEEWLLRTGDVIYVPERLL